MAGKNGKTRPFTAVNYSAAKLAREKQRREYEQQKKEKLIFALFVVIILVMILFAILIFRKVLGDDEPIGTETETETQTQTEAPEDTGTQPVSNTYEQIMVEKSDLHAGHLLLINGSHSYRAGETLDLQNIYASRTKFEKANSDKIVYSYYTAGSEGKLERETLAALNAMADAFYEKYGNNDLYIHTPDAAYVKEATDEHATGRAFDLSVFTADYVRYSLDDPSISSDFNWVKENYYKYGFIRRYPAHKAEITGVSDEPYHFLYVGTAHSYYMYENDLCLEEYLELLRTKHTFKNGGANNLAVTTDGGERYEIYFVAADGDKISLPIPSACESYSYSGNNADGFVVTVKYGRTYE